MSSFGVLIFNLVLLIIGSVMPDSTDQYLYKFGYLQPAAIAKKGTGKPYNLNKSKENAIRKFQAAAGIAMTGSADFPTQLKMQQSTCGQPQPVEDSNPPAPWKGPIKYYIKNIGSGKKQFTAEVQRDLITAAFGMYAKAVPALTFHEVPSAHEANITLGFATNDHGDGHNFDGRGKVLAHAFYPSDGRVHFDDDEFWMHMQRPPQINTLIKISIQESFTHIDFFTVAIHEIGHALGLAHILNNAASILAPLYQSPIKSDGTYILPTLDEAVIKNLKSIYEQGNGIVDNRIPEQMRANHDCMKQVYAVFNLPDHRIVFFIENGKRLVMFNSMSFQMVQNVNISNLFTSGPSQVMAAYYNEESERIMLFSGNMIWAYDFLNEKNEVALAQNFPKTLGNGHYMSVTGAFRMNERIFLVNKSYVVAHYNEDANWITVKGHINKVFPNMPQDTAAFAEFNFGKKFGFTQSRLFKYHGRERRTERIGDISKYFNCLF